jgi:hypothetical protein
MDVWNLKMMVVWNKGPSMQIQDQGPFAKSSRDWRHALLILGTTPYVVGGLFSILKSAWLTGISFL